MRGFLKRLRKGLKTACITAALTTCWQIGQVAKADITLPNPGDQVTIRFSGTVSPEVNDISHVYLIYGAGSSGSWSGFQAVSLGDFPVGHSSSFSVLGTVIYDNYWIWYAAGLYGDITSGEYIEGVNGVNLGIQAAEGQPWDWVFRISEETAFASLLNDTPEDISSEYWPDHEHRHEMTGLEFADSSVLFNFSNAVQNGQIEINVEVVPEPISFVLFGTGGMIAVALRRRRYLNQ
jgi:hypothetical protein